MGVPVARPPPHVVMHGTGHMRSLREALAPPRMLAPSDRAWRSPVNNRVLAEDAGPRRPKIYVLNLDERWRTVLDPHEEQGLYGLEIVSQAVCACAADLIHTRVTPSPRTHNALSLPCQCDVPPARSC
eukprot:355239-Chlamydomonas_euryale.AAC.4